VVLYVYIVFTYNGEGKELIFVVNYLLHTYPVGKIAKKKKLFEGVRFLLIRHSKYSALTG